MYKHFPIKINTEAIFSLVFTTRFLKLIAILTSAIENSKIRELTALLPYGGRMFAIYTTSFHQEKQFPRIL